MTAPPTASKRRYCKTDNYPLLRLFFSEKHKIKLTLINLMSLLPQKIKITYLVNTSGE